MDQLVNVLLLLAFNKACTVPQRSLDCRPDLGGLNQAYGPNRLSPSACRICAKNNYILIRCTNRNQFDILMTAVIYVRKGQRYMQR